MATEGKRSQRDYTLAFKLGVVRAVEKSEITYKQARKKFGIQGRSTVLVTMAQEVRLTQPKIGTRKLYYLLKQRLY